MIGHLSNAAIYKYDVTLHNKHKKLWLEDSRSLLRALEEITRSNNLKENFEVTIAWKQKAGIDVKLFPWVPWCGMKVAGAARMSRVRVLRTQNACLKMSLTHSSLETGCSKVPVTFLCRCAHLQDGLSCCHIVLFRHSEEWKVFSFMQGARALKRAYIPKINQKGRSTSYIY